MFNEVQLRNSLKVWILINRLSISKKVWKQLELEILDAQVGNYFVTELEKENLPLA
jgi:hypothetical protein